MSRGRPGQSPSAGPTSSASARSRWTGCSTTSTRGQSGRSAGQAQCLFPVSAKGVEVVEIFVAVERHPPVGGRRAIEQRDDPFQARQVDLRFSGQLDLEIAQAVGTNGRLEILRQPVFDSLLRSDVCGRQRIAEADRVAHVTGAERLTRQQFADGYRAELGIDAPRSRASAPWCRTRCRGSPSARQRASSTARSTRLTPRCASRGAIPRAAAHAVCCRSSSRQRSKNVTGWRAIPAAAVVAWRIAASISGRSCSNVVDGFFVNHFGGRPSAARPARLRPSERICAPDEDLRHVRHARDAVAKGKTGTRRQHEQVERRQRELHGLIDRGTPMTDPVPSPAPRSSGPPPTVSASRTRNPGARSGRGRRRARARRDRWPRRSRRRFRRGSP